MQQVTRKTLGAGINLTCVTTPKFKRAVLRAMLVLPLGGEDAALRACLLGAGIACVAVKPPQLHINYVCVTPTYTV